MAEFALLAPLIFVLLLGMVDFGRVLFYADELTNAAREGGRVVVLPTNTCNTTFGPPCASTNTNSGETVCQAIRDATQLVSAAEWQGCPNTASSTDATPALPAGVAAGTAAATTGAGCSPCQNDVYVTIEQATTTSANCTDSSWSSESVTTTPRGSGTSTNLPIKITLYYYYRPFTPMIGQFFPTTFRLVTSTCARPEY